MASSIAPLSLFADVVLCLTLAMTLVNPKVSLLARPAIATFVLASAWLITAVVDAVGAPRWTIFLGGGVIVVSLVVVLATLHSWTQAGDAAARGGDQGGGGVRRPRPDAPQPGGDPSWWPEFERELAVYVAERQQREPTTLSNVRVTPSLPRRRSCGPVLPATSHSTRGGRPATPRAPDSRFRPRCAWRRRQRR